MTWTFWHGAAAKIFGALLAVVSPEIRKMLVEFLRDLKEQADATPNPLDDFLVNLLMKLVDVQPKK